MTTEQINLDLEELKRMGVAEARELLQNLVAKEPTTDDEDKITIIQELKLPGDVSIDMLYQLVDYKYLEFADDVKVGMFLKWIPLKKPDEIRLKHGAVVCKIRETEDDEVYIVCRLLKRVGGRTVLFELNFDENLLFFKRY
jgi:hypothetical protein